jgi:O-antigen ligase
MSVGALAFLLMPSRGIAGLVLSLCGAALCGALLLASHSQTALIVLLAIILLSFLSALLRLEWRQAWGSVLLLLLTCAPLAWLAVSHANSLTLLLHRDITLTGRSRIWAYASLSFVKRPWLGYGYGAFWWVADESRQVLALIGYKTPHAHNGFLDLGLQLGVAGVAVFLAGWLVALCAAVRHLRLHPVKCARWPLLYLCFIAIYSVTENSLLIPNSLLWVLYIAAAATVMRSPLPQTAPDSCRNCASISPAVLSATVR